MGVPSPAHALEPPNSDAATPGGAPIRALRIGGRAALFSGLLFWVTLLVMVAPTTALPTASLLPIAAAQSPASLPVGGPNHGIGTSATPIGQGAAAISSIPGTIPSGVRSYPGEVPAQVPLLDQGRPINWSSVNLQYRGLATSDPTPPPAAPVPAVGIINPTGYVTGTVCAQGGGNPCVSPVQGVSVTAFSNIGGDCPTCSPANTNASGYFSVRCPAGADYATFQLSFWLDNLTYFTCSAGVSNDVGIVYLVPEAIGTGNVYSNTTNTPALAGVAVTATSRDQQVHGSPAGTTSTSGYFKIGIPPLPSQITFQPPPGYLGTFTYVNATPGQTINFGKIYLQKLVPVKATLYDATTGGLISSGSCSPFNPVCRTITVCSSVTNVCSPQGESVGSPNVEATSIAGQSYLIAFATGYQVNYVPIGLVPWNPTGGVYNAGKIYLVPYGAVDLSVQVTHNTTPLPGKWGLGIYSASICSMNGLSGSGVTINAATFTVNMTPTTCLGGCSGTGVSRFASLGLRNDVSITPDTTGTCGNGIPQWPTPGLTYYGQSPDLPVWGNETWVNVTPNEVTFSYLNLTPGTYVSGTVFTAGTIKAPTNFNVIAISSESTSMASYSFIKGTNSWACGGSQASTSFCVPVPPGGWKLQASATGFPTNFTWGYAPRVCCYSAVEPMTLPRATQPSVASINLTAPGAVYGHIFQAGTNLGVFFGSVQVCPASPNSRGQQCDDGIVYYNGTFFSGAPLGWDSITASAAGYNPNTVWAYVTGNDSVGNISLTHLVTIAGQVVDPTGHSIYEASVHYCHVDQTATCAIPLGAGQSTSAGGYNGTVVGGWLPWTTYELQISASGYTTDWVWVNATLNQSTTAPTVVLRPLGTNTTSLLPTSRSARSSASAGPAGVWVDGTLTDNSTNWGVVTSSIAACPTNGGLCSPFSDGSNQQGYFNSSVLAGLYFLNVTAVGYQPISIFFNATAAAYIHLGRILMFAWGWVDGYANMTPFGSVNVLKTGSSSVHVTILYAPGATAFGCTAALNPCGTALPASSQGYFSVQAPPGLYDRVSVSPSGGTTTTSINGGFGSNVSNFNTTGNTTTFTNWAGTTTLLENLTLAVNVMVGGIIYDASTTNPVTGATPWQPARFVSVAVTTLGPNHANAAYITNGGGLYVFFIPGNVNDTFITATEQGSFVTNISETIGYLSNALPVRVYGMPPMNLTHFGWIEGWVRDSVSHVGVAYTSIDASGIDPLTNSSIRTSEQTNGAGFVNVTAPPFRVVSVLAGGSNDYNSTTATEWVNQSATTYLNSSFSAPGPGNLYIDPWGWVRSVDLNTTFLPDLPTVIDKVNGFPLPTTQVTVTSSDTGLPNGGGQVTSWAGQFLVDAPIGPVDTLLFQHDAYERNTSLIRVEPGAVLAYPTVNMTGVGILAGVVISYPGDRPLAGATVQACPYGSLLAVNCYSTVTNASGLYWVAATPGQVLLTVSADGYVSNSSVVATACSDCWSWVLPITLNEFAYIFGTVRGLPSGLPLAGAQVSVCSTLAIPVGACSFTVTTARNGIFVLTAPSGRYILNATDNRFNTSYLPVAVQPGEHLPVGTIFLQAFGYVLGTVLSATTFAPIFNASVYGCARWTGGNCSPTQSTDRGGHYTFGGAPGPYTITVEAVGYSDSYAEAVVTSGANRTLPAILLEPLGTNLFYAVAGNVVNASDPSQPVAGATIAVIANSTVAFSTLSLADGSFSLPVLYGTYNLSVGAPGYVVSSQLLVVHGPVSGILVALAITTYTVSGTARDALTSAPVAGVQISDSFGGSLLAVSAADGSFAFALPNGSYLLAAAYAGHGPVAYPGFQFSLQVNGADQVHDLALAPPTVLVHGNVVDAVSGTPLAGASVSVRGTTADGIPISLSLTANPAGGFSVSLPTGNYSITATFTGYQTRAISIDTTTVAAPVTLAMSPTAPSSSGPAAPSGAPVLMLLGIAVAVAGVVALAAVVVMLVRSRRRPPATGSPAGEKST